jgi:uncharacterized protein (TIGR02466 family)
MIETTERYIFPTFLFESIDKEFNYKNDLIDACYSLKSNFSESTRRSNVNGWQSPTFNAQNNPEFFQSNFCKNIWNQFIETSKHFNLKESYLFYLKDIWININSPGSYNLSHIHPLNYVSGVFYVKVPKNSGCITFENVLEKNTVLPFYTTNDTLRMIEQIVPEEGKMVLFSSYLPHNVEQNNSDDDRISISFNVSVVEPPKNIKKRSKHIFN